MLIFVLRFPSLSRQPNRKVIKRLTENEHGVRKSPEDGEKQASNDTGTENLEQHLAAIGEVGGGQEHQISIHQDQEQIPKHGGGAGQEPVGLITRGLRIHREGVESEVGSGDVGQVVVDAIGDQILRRGLGVRDEAAAGVAAEDQEEEEEGDVRRRHVASFSASAGHESGFGCEVAVGELIK